MVRYYPPKIRSFKYSDEIIIKNYAGNFGFVSLRYKL
jgi:hypothetical protein